MFTCPNPIKNVLSASLNNFVPDFYIQLNQQFMRKIPDGSEAANVMVGELEGLTYHVVAFIRLTEARPIGDLTEVPILTRFLFFLFGPEGSQQKITEIGRSMSTIMVDEVNIFVSINFHPTLILIF